MSSDAELIAALRAQIKATEARAAKAEAKIATIKAEASVAKAKAKAAEDKLAAMSKTVVHVVQVAPVIFGRLKSIISDVQQIADLPEMQLDILAREVNDFSAVFAKIVNLGKLVAWQENKHSESIGKSIPESEKASVEDLEKTVRSTVCSIKKCQQKLTQALDVISTAAKQAKADNSKTRSAAVEAAAAIADMAVPEVEAPSVELEDGKKTRGRQVVESKQTAKKIECPVPEEPRCPNCGSTDYEISDTPHLTHLRNLSRKIEESIINLELETRNGRCHACGHAHVHVSPEAPMPVAPGRTISNAMAAETGYAMSIGIPVYRQQHKILCDGSEQIGNATLADNVHDFAMTAGKCMVDALQKRYANQYALVVDETPFKCLQSEGRGKCQSPAEEDIRATNQILAISSVPGADEPFVFYRMLGNRSGTSILRELEDFHPSVIVTDACASYNTVLKHRPRLRHQSCLTHWRRKILVAAQLELAAAEAQGTDASAKIAKRLVNGDPLFLLAMVVDGMRKLYAVESYLSRGPEESRAAHLERIRHGRATFSAPLMTSIDRIMVELAKSYAREKREGCWEKAESSLIADAVVYYMNQREAFHCFLNDPRIPPDSNAVERAIRPLTVLRNAINSKQSVERTKSMCIWFTLFETAKMNGIKNPVKWLTEFGNAYVRHCANRTLTEALLEGQKLDAKVIGLRPGSDKDFDCTPWLPSVYAASAANTDD